MRTAATLRKGNGGSLHALSEPQMDRSAVLLEVEMLARALLNYKCGSTARYSFAAADKSTPGSGELSLPG